MALPFRRRIFVVLVLMAAVPTGLAVVGWVLTVRTFGPTAGARASLEEVATSARGMLEQTIAPWDPGRYRHNETGEDNAAAHLRSLTVGHEVTVPITKGELDFGPWQRVFYGEWDGQRKKRVIIKVLGE